MSEKISIQHNSVENIDFAAATAIFVYLVPEGMRTIVDRLMEAYNKNVRIVSYIFSIPGLVPVEVSRMFNSL